MTRFDGVNGPRWSGRAHVSVIEKPPQIRRLLQKAGRGPLLSYRDGFALRLPFRHLLIVAWRLYPGRYVHPQAIVLTDKSEGVA